MHFYFINADTGESILDISCLGYIEAVQAFADEFRIDPETLLRKGEIYIEQIDD
jgi:hypothetical protein